MTKKLLLDEINIKSELISVLNNIVIQQETQINYYRDMLLLLQKNIDIIKKILDDEN